MKKLAYWIMLGVPMVIAWVSCSPQDTAHGVSPRLGLKDFKRKTGVELPKDSVLLMSMVDSREDVDNWIIQMSSTNQLHFPETAGPWISSDALTGIAVKRLKTHTGISISNPSVSNGTWNLASNIQCQAAIVIAGKDEYFELKRFH